MDDDYAAFEYTCGTAGFVHFDQEQRMRLREDNPTSYHRMPEFQVKNSLWTAWCKLSQKERDAYKEGREVVEIRSLPDTEAPLFEWLSDDLIFEVLRHLGARSLSYTCCASRLLWNVERAHSDELWKAAIERRMNDNHVQHHSANLTSNRMVLYRGALDPGGVRARQGWSFKKRFIDVVKTFDVGGCKRQQEKTAEDLNDGFDFFIQLCSKDPPSSCKFQTLKVQAMSDDYDPLYFGLCEETFLSVEPAGLELHALRRADGAMTRLFEASLEAKEYRGRRVEKRMCLWHIMKDVDIGWDALPISFGSLEGFELGAEVSLNYSAGGPTRLKELLPVFLEPPDGFRLEALHWKDEDGDRTEDEFDVAGLYNALHGTRNRPQRWT